LGAAVIEVAAPAMIVLQLRINTEYDSFLV